MTPAGAVALNGHSVRGPVVEALVGLGFAVKQAEEATDKVLANEPEANTSSALRAALSMLGKNDDRAASTTTSPRTPPTGRSPPP